MRGGGYAAYAVGVSQDDHSANTWTRQTAHKMYILCYNMCAIAFVVWLRGMLSEFQGSGFFSWPEVRVTVVFQ
jgi:hypothetical protein